MMKILVAVAFCLASCDGASKVQTITAPQGRCDMAFDEFEFDDDGNLVQTEYPPDTVELLEDPFQGAVNLAREHGYGLPKPTPYNEWVQLSQGKTIGKRGNLSIGVDGQLTDTINLLEVGGPDQAAINLCITLIPPQRIYNAFPVVTDPINATGSQSINALFDDHLPEFTGTLVDVFAIIEWGIGGVQSSAEIDYVHGTQINIQASWVRLRASGRLMSGTNELLTVGAFIGPGQASNQGSAQRSVYPRNPAAPNVYDFGTIAPGTKSFFMPVPDFAKRVRVVGNIQFGGAYPAVVPHIALEFHQDQNPAGSPDGLFNWDLEGFALYDESYPIPSGISFIRLHNHGAVGIAGMGLVYELNL